MIDLHNHILPGIDDGSKNLEETIEMAKIAVSEGITKIVVTPHHRRSDYLVEKEDILKKIKYINKVFGDKNISLDIYPGMEIHMSRDIPEKLKNNELLSLNNSRYILIEFPFRGDLDYTEDVLHEIKILGYVPIIAHPERYEKVMKDPNYVKELIENGCLIQMNSNSLIGQFGEECKRTAEILIEHKMVHLLATDAHSCKRRCPKLKQDIEKIKQINNEQYIRSIIDNADKVFNNEEIKIEDALIYKLNKGWIKKFTKLLNIKR